MLMPFNRKKLYFIGVGSGRCGTLFTATLLNHVNLFFSHERIFGPLGLEYAVKVLHEGGEDSAISQELGFKSKKILLGEFSWLAVPYLSYGIIADATIIHIVRNPIDVILSFHNKLQYWHKKELNKWENFILMHLPELKQYHSALMKNCCYVVRWNQWIEKQSIGRNYIRIRIEKDINQLLDYLQIPTGLRPKLSKINTHESWKQKEKPLKNPATKEDILNSGFGNQVKLLMGNYNYEV